MKKLPLNRNLRNAQRDAYSRRGIWKPAILLFLLLFSGLLWGSPLNCVYAGDTGASTAEVHYKYLIIVPDDAGWVDALRPFVDWKTKEGLQYSSGYPADCLPVKVTNLTEISSAYGSANASCIRQYIVDFWNSNNCTTGQNSLRYVLLAGDVKHVPTYFYNVSISGNEYGYATDQYFADFYHPATGQYINPTIDKTDWNPEVYVGRFPVNTAEELRKLVDKTVAYEMYSGGLLSAPAGWERRMLFLGAILDNGESLGLQPVWKDGAYVAEYVKRSCQDSWTGTTGPIPDPTTLYNTNDNTLIWDSGYGNLNDLHNLTTMGIVNQMSNQGSSAVLSVSHGNTQSLQGRESGSPGSWDIPFFENADVSLLSNGYALPFWFADACYTGAFQIDLDTAGRKCLGEELLLSDSSSNGGVVGFIGCSDVSWYEYATGYPQNRPSTVNTLSDQLAILTFSELYEASASIDYSPAKWGLGAALLEAKREYYNTAWDTRFSDKVHMATCLGFNLLGDPSLQVWSEKPRDASTFYDISAPATVKEGAHFSVDVSFTDFISGRSYPPYGPRIGAKVCLSRADGNQTAWCTVNVTDNTGTTTFTAPTMPGAYNLTVVDHPYMIPYTVQIQVLPPDRDVAVTAVSVSQTLLGQGFTLEINATVGSLGDCAEAFNVTAYANQTVIETKAVALVSHESALLTFLWDTTGHELGNYIIKIEADPVPNETNAANNTLYADYAVSVVPEFAIAALLLLMILPLATAFAFTRHKRDLLCQPPERSQRADGSAFARHEHRSKEGF